jgi:hypothetical protein
LGYMPLTRPGLNYMCALCLKLRNYIPYLQAWEKFAVG